MRDITLKMDIEDVLILRGAMTHMLTELEETVANLHSREAKTDEEVHRNEHLILRTTNRYVKLQQLKVRLNEAVEGRHN